MKNNIIILCAFLFLFAGCNQKTVYKKFKPLSPDVEWLKSLEIEFNLEIKDNSVPYEISFVLNHHTIYPYSHCSLKVTQISPSVKKLIKNYALQIKGEDGKLIGKGAGDYWDLKEIVETNYLFKEKGQYSYIVEHVMPREVLTHVYRLGLIVAKGKSSNQD